MYLCSPAPQMYVYCTLERTIPTILLLSIAASIFAIFMPGIYPIEDKWPLMFAWTTMAFSSLTLTGSLKNVSSMLLELLRSISLESFGILDEMCFLLVGRIRNSKLQARLLYIQFLHHR